MNDARLLLALVNTAASGGGAQAAARQLADGLRKRDQDAWLLVGRGEPEGALTLPFPSDVQTRMAHLLAGPLRLLDRARGIETWHYPASARMLEALPRAPDLVHLHNLHGGYFDLREIPRLARAFPVAMTLHDAWLLSGHCAHSMGCDRWKTGCGSCPDLEIYPAIRRDATRENWLRKREIFRQSRLHVAVPSRWLAQRAGESILAPAMKELRVIPNGVDLETFRPGDRETGRARHGIAPDEPVLLFVGPGGGKSGFKDLPTAEDAAVRAAELLDRDLTLIVLGESGPGRRRGRATIRTVPFEGARATVASWYRAADLHLHAARADTFPTTVLEALATGIPVVATSVGGIPEQIRGLAGPWAPANGAGSDAGDLPEGSDLPQGSEGATGILVPERDAEGMAGGIAHLLADESLRRTLGRNARRDAELRFDENLQFDRYLEWFQKIIADWREAR